MPTRSSVLFGLALLLVSAAIAATGRQPQSSKPEPAQPDIAGPAAARAPKPKFDEAKALADLRKEIAGKENEPAGKVFMDIDLMAGMTAAQLLLTMEKGYSRPWESPAPTATSPANGKATKRKRRKLPGA